MVGVRGLGGKLASCIDAALENLHCDARLTPDFLHCRRGAAEVRKQVSSAYLGDLPKSISGLNLSATGPAVSRSRSDAGPVGGEGKIPTSTISVSFDKRKELNKILSLINKEWHATWLREVGVPPCRKPH